MTRSPVLRAVRFGVSRTAAVWGLVLFLLAVNAATAAVLALPLYRQLSQDLDHSMSSVRMLYGFDYTWWSRWSEEHPRWSFSPDVLGVGFSFKNLDLLLRGALPLGLFRVARDAPPSEGAAEGQVEATILAVGAAYALVQVFLAGGLLGVLRAPQAAWTVRGLLHGAGFYVGRFLRLGLLTLALQALLFLAYVPFAYWVEDQGREAVSGRTALLWYLGRSLLLLLAVLAVHMVASYARVIIVLEERASALLALVSSAAFCARHVLRTFGHVLLMALGGLLTLALFAVADARWDTTGYKTQLVTLLLLEGFVFARLFLRVALLGGQVDLYRSLVEAETAPRP